jgi:hypothetical protein
LKESAMSMSPVVNFANVSRADVAQVGGNNASTGEIIAALQKQGGLTAARQKCCCVYAIVKPAKFSAKFLA